MYIGNCMAKALVQRLERLCALTGEFGCGFFGRRLMLERWTRPGMLWTW